jgi:hypothetical protein
MTDTAGYWRDQCEQCRIERDELRFAAAMKQPLSDDDIEAIASSVRPISVSGEPSWEHAIARAIERAHGIG